MLNLLHNIISKNSERSASAVDSVFMACNKDIAHLPQIVNYALVKKIEGIKEDKGSAMMQPLPEGISIS